MALTLMGCGARDKTSQVETVTESEKPRPGETVEQARERRQKATALGHRLLIDINRVTLIARNEQSLSFRVYLTINNRSQSGVLSLRIQKGEVEYQEKSQLLTESEIKAGVVLETLVYRSQNDLSLGLALQMRQTKTSQEKTAQQLVKLTQPNGSESSNMTISDKRFEFPAQSQLQRWMNE